MGGRVHWTLPMRTAAVKIRLGRGLQCHLSASYPAAKRVRHVPPANRRPARPEIPRYHNPDLRKVGYKIILAANGRKIQSASAVNARATIEAYPGNSDLVVLCLDAETNADVVWTVSFNLRGH
jgi:hypothetical protein